MKNIIILLLLTVSNLSIYSQINNLDEFNSELDGILNTYISNGLVDYNGLSKNTSFKKVVSFTETVDINTIPEADRKAFRINTYNVQVLQGALNIYPSASVQDQSGFFDRVKRNIEGESTTLNDFEKKKLLQIYNDPRLHFVLVCGASGCPPIINSIYKSETLDNQLEQQTRLALNNPNFLKENEKSLQLSQIFQWYASDFGGSNKKVIRYINQFRDTKIDENSSFSYYDYDWSLNDKNPVILTTEGNSANRYVVSAAIPKGSFEFKVFNNLYSQSIDNSRSTFYTAALSALYGLTNRFNIGIAGRYRLVSNHDVESTPFDVFGFRNANSSRSGLTGLGPQIRWAPFPALKNFSIQSSFTFPIGKELQGNNDKPFIDWNGAVFNTQFFNDFTINSKFSIFTEIDVLIEDIGVNVENHSFRTSTPATLIGSYFPTPKATIYVISGFSPFWQKEFDYFYQYGAGGKYQITNDFEIEVLYTSFRNKYLLSKDGKAETINFGIRYSL